MNIIIPFIAILASLLSSCHKAHHHSYQGYVEGENLYLASPYSGDLVETFVKRGQRVKKGQLLFRLDDNPQLLDVKQDQALLMQAKKVLADLSKPRRLPEVNAIIAQIAQVDAQINLAALRVKRNQELVKKSALDQDSLDASVERFNELKYLKIQTEENLKLAKEGSRPDQIKAQKALVYSLLARVNNDKWKLSQKSIYAPADGVIFDTYFLKGEWVDSSQPIASLLEPNNIRIEFFVPVKELASVHVNQTITFDCDGCTKENKARISYISPEAEYIPPLVYSRENNDKLVFRIKAALNHPEQFKPGQPVIVMVPIHD
jgi:HlyD family secretion protein